MSREVNAIIVEGTILRFDKYGRLHLRATSASQAKINRVHQQYLARYGPKIPVIINPFEPMPEIFAMSMPLHGCDLCIKWKFTRELSTGVNISVRAKPRVYKIDKEQQGRRHSQLGWYLSAIDYELITQR